MSGINFSSHAAAAPSGEAAKTEAPPSVGFSPAPAGAPPAGVVRRPASLFDAKNSGASMGGGGQGRGGQQQSSQGGAEMADTEIVEVFEMPRPARRVNKNLFDGHGADLKSLFKNQPR